MTARELSDILTLIAEDVARHNNVRISRVEFNDMGGGAILIERMQMLGSAEG